MEQNQDYKPSHETSSPTTPAPTIEQYRSTQPAMARTATFAMIQKVTAWVMICTAILFALIGIMAVWEVFGPDGGDVVMKAFSSLAIVAFAALVVNVAARLIEDAHK
jgi:cytochrome b subunit of formate dehydrogenase